MAQCQLRSAHSMPTQQELTRNFPLVRYISLGVILSLSAAGEFIEVVLNFFTKGASRRHIFQMQL